jgi:RNA polymerase sigma-70 factor (ECF subfamily)
MEPENELRTFNQLFTNHQKRFIRFANGYVRDWAVAEDITTDAFMYYWEHRQTLTSDLNIPAYILTIVKHKCLNHLQHIQVHEAAAEKLKEHADWELCTRIATLEACEPDELFASEIQAIAERTLASMPEQTRQIFVMSRYDNQSYKEIASRMDMTVKGVEFHISKALKSLHHNLKDYLSVFIGIFI